MQRSCDAVLRRNIRLTITIQMWSQLGLDASLSLPENDVGTQQYPNKLIISLTRQAASQADVKPPSGVPSVCLENISMVLCLSTCRRSRLSSKARADSNKSRDTLNENAALGAHLRCNNVDKRWDSHMLSLKWAQDIRDPSEERSRFGIAKAELNPSRIMTDPFSMKTSPTISGSTVSSKSSLSQSTDGMYITGRCPQRHGYAIHEISFRDLLMMVDMSLRTMISGHLATRSVGIILSSDAGYPKLVDASPALFCPGYFKVSLLPATLEIYEKYSC